MIETNQELEEIKQYLWQEVDSYDLSWESDCDKLAEKLYKDGWHRQRVGTIIHTIKDGKCNRVFSCCGRDFTNLTTWMIPDYCPACGAKIVNDL